MTTDRERIMKHHAQLENERSSWWPHWADLATNLAPRRARFLSSDRNRGTKQNQNVINANPLLALRTLKSGMQSGITPQSRPWFRLTTQDPNLSLSKGVRIWLDTVEERIRSTFSKSNFYNSTHTLYGDIATFGVSPMYIEDDPLSTIRCYVFPIGQYYLANSRRLEIDTVHRRYSMTVGQLVAQFGLEKCSAAVQTQFKNNTTEAWAEVLHVVEPNPDAKPGKLGPENMAFRSFWFEYAAQNEGDEPLRRGGYNEFPVCVPRWDVAGEDVYGSCPGMDALGDVRALQLYERRKAQAIEMIIRPPMRGPMSLLNQRSNLMPGETTYVPDNVSGQVFGPAIEVPPEVVTVATNETREIEERIDAVFYADLWLAMSQLEKGQVTAREVQERHEEKLIQLGPVTERLQSELLKPAIDRTFGILLRAGRIPPPPRELQGQDLKIEYVSPMAQAQKAVASGAVERVVAFVQNLQQVNPESIDKLNTDATIDEYADDMGTPAKLIRTDDEVAQIRQQRAQAQQQQQQMAAAAAAAKGAADLSKAKLDDDNALSRFVGNAFPAGAAGPSGGTVQ